MLLGFDREKNRIWIQIVKRKAKKAFCYYLGGTQTVMLMLTLHQEEERKGRNSFFFFNKE
jgi:hypothetical protein